MAINLDDKSFYNTREIKKLDKMADKILALETKFSKLSDEELKGKTQEFKDRLSKGETLDDILYEAFATIREAAYRVLGKKHYKVQLIGGMVLHQGRIAEMKTGEGKTLTATAPAYLNALEGKGAHVITVNEYLAQRDRDEMNHIYEFLGLTSSVIIAKMSEDAKRAAYSADITYGTNSEFGFDFLRDNMVSEMEKKVQRPLHYCVVDEIDSILIDEARTPLIISGVSGQADEMIKVADYFVKGLKHKVDYTIDGKAKMALLTDDGVEKVEKYFNIENYADVSNFNIQHYVVQALKANFIMKNGVDYIIREGKIHIVDQFTGRVMDGRRFSDGLHEAIEAKEEVQIQDKTKTMATITYQNFFRMYKKLSGMTGTAKTEEMEFREIYNLDVVVVPTNKPILREDKDDIIYKTEFEKFKAVVAEIVETYKTKQPILVGTVSIEKSELLSFMLKKAGIPHQVLNAKHHAKEAEIIAKAGEKGAITISTNMAGRGTDIILGEGVREIGGLKVIGTEKHESRRIDNQLRGRSGRQGDVGISRFYVSFEDDLIKNHTSDRFKKTLEKFNLKEGEAIEEPLAAKAVENAQKNVEAGNFQTRKNLIQFDDVVNTQRQIIYTQRDQVLLGEELHMQVQHMLSDVMKEAVHTELEIYKKEEKTLEEALLKFKANVEELLNMAEGISVDYIKPLVGKKGELLDYIMKLSTEAFAEKQELLSTLKGIEKAVMLKVVDDNWVEHLEKMEHLKQYIGLQAYKQQDPVVIYQLEGSKLFDEMILNIKKQVVRYIFSIKIEQ